MLGNCTGSIRRTCYEGLSGESTRNKETTSKYFIKIILLMVYFITILHILIILCLYHSETSGYRYRLERCRLIDQSEWRVVVNMDA